MTKLEMETAVKLNLSGTGVNNLTISDVILEMCSYCNIPLDKIPDALEPLIRKKVRGILLYEQANGTGFVQEVQSIKEGDGSITFAQTDGNTKASIYGLSDSEKSDLHRYRRLRGYD